MSSIEKTTSTIGGLLTVLGIGFYIATGMRSKTALIPLVFGLPVMFCGFGMASSSRAVKAMIAHAATILTVFAAFSGCGMATVNILKGKFTLSVLEQLLMGTFSVVHIIASIRHFKSQKFAAVSGAKLTTKPHRSNKID
mmetsp:Transcript_21748/g.30733  ORF Transcript_21748/g.30733 Transcript_21748/m.30733 type:complete len:139 (+) Transcript_21748:24-440(+)